MQITQLKPFKVLPGKKAQRYLVYLDGKIAFVLYRGDLSHFRLYEQGDMPDDIYQEITEQLLPKRAADRLLHLLEKKDYTEWELRDKLKESYYPEGAIEYAINSMKSYKYLDDVRYVKRYIEFRIASKTKRQLYMELQRKGIAKEFFECIFSELEEEGTISESSYEEELHIAEHMLQKRHYDAELADERERSKQYNYLMGKGVRQDIIRKVLAECKGSGYLT